jgi:hypothetical protein
MNDVARLSSLAQPRAKTAGFDRQQANLAGWGRQIRMFREEIVHLAIYH